MHAHLEMVWCPNPLVQDAVIASLNRHAWPDPCAEASRGHTCRLHTQDRSFDID